MVESYLNLVYIHNQLIERKMKRFILLPFLFGLTYCIAQEKIESDGMNLAPICVAPCNYIAFQESIYFPFEYDKEWQIDNMELALKESGEFLIVGDLFIVGEDTAAVLDLEFLFFDKDLKTVYKHKPGKFEFFNEPNYAEPIVFTGQIPQEISAKIKYLDVGIESSERVPYYSISSNCFQPCKNLLLSDAMKAFKKKKKKKK